jgi:large subunit ribosomal protein L17
MRHHNGLKKLGRTSAHRRALLRNLATALLTHERIETTEVKAKALRSYVESLITLGKRGDLHARRLVARDIQGPETLKKLFGDVAARFAGRAGGYTRVLKLGRRHGDCAEMAMIELVDRGASSQSVSQPEA